MLRHLVLSKKSIHLYGTLSANRVLFYDPNSIQTGIHAAQLPCLMYTYVLLN